MFYNLKDKKLRKQEKKGEILHRQLPKKTEKSPVSYRQPSSCLISQIQNTKALLRDRKATKAGGAEKGQWEKCRCVYGHMPSYDCAGMGLCSINVLCGVWLCVDSACVCCLLWTWLCERAWNHVIKLLNITSWGNHGSWHIGTLKASTATPDQCWPPGRSSSSSWWWKEGRWAGRRECGGDC